MADEAAPAIPRSVAWFISKLPRFSLSLPFSSHQITNLAYWWTVSKEYVTEEEGDIKACHVEELPLLQPLRASLIVALPLQDPPTPAFSIHHQPLTFRHRSTLHGSGLQRVVVQPPIRCVPPPGGRLAAFMNPTPPKSSPNRVDATLYMVIGKRSPTAPPHCQQYHARPPAVHRRPCPRCHGD